MTIDMIFHTLFLLCLAGLAVKVVWHDVATMEIPVVPVLALTGLSILTGVLFPLPGLDSNAAFVGAAMGLALGTLTRGYIHLRTGIAAFGGADISLVTAGGGLLGPWLLGPWAILICTVAILGARLLPKAGFRMQSIEGETLEVLPLCPSLIVSAAMTYLAAASSLLPATGLFLG